MPVFADDFSDTTPSFTPKNATFADALMLRHIFRYFAMLFAATVIFHYARRHFFRFSIFRHARC